MFELLVFLFLVLLVFFVGSYGGYYLYLRSRVGKPWGFVVDEGFEPSVSVLIPVHNEEKKIEEKLENVSGVVYPREKLEVVVVDDASSDETLSKVKGFNERNPSLNVKIVKQEVHGGKAVALNKALSACSGSVLVVSDADTLWPADALKRALAFLADPVVGAVTGRSVNRVAGESWVTRGEDEYLRFAEVVRLGESKVHSTIRFEGGLCAFRREAFERFDCVSGSDDSGTALEVVQNGFRAVLAPGAVFFTEFPSGFGGKLRVKVRRANQLIGLWVKCFKLLLKGELRLPKSIVIPEFLLFVVDSILFVMLIATAVVGIVVFPFSMFTLLVAILLLGGVVAGRRLFFEIVVDNLILFYALLERLTGKRYVAWKRTDA
jgi:cellulose synthase/poly-beta-1,6-N-acetylglucosamine synthase-like glycosyltransferase